MKIFTSLTLAATAMMASLPMNASAEKVGMLVGHDDMSAANAQEAAAAAWFTSAFPEGALITLSSIEKINAADLDALWIHIDRIGIGHGADRLPEEMAGAAVKEALTNYIKDGGSLYLSKHATQLVSALGRLPENYAPGIFGDGDGGRGTDIWTVNALFGSMQFNAAEPDLTQVYDRRNHPAYAGLETIAPEKTGYPHESFPMEGTADGTAIHREDHNCMWDLNAYSYTTEGKNTLEKFESQFDCTVIGTWGHVQDYCVAGLVDFNPTTEIKGRIVANGLAACEWAPRTENNAFHSNLEKLTGNILTYLAQSNSTGISSVGAAETPVAYYSLQGVKVNNPSAGIFIRVADCKATKVVIR
ncbi:MAG: DUF4960 domain-containing protein [Muribaculaceae bacterium]|nr:DUF4960 domain-containing protein [Muribaculaceae bacterium]